LRRELHGDLNAIPTSYVRVNSLGMWKDDSTRCLLLSTRISSSSRDDGYPERRKMLRLSFVLSLVYFLCFPAFFSSLTRERRFDDQRQVDRFNLDVVPRLNP